MKRGIGLFSGMCLVARSMIDSMIFLMPQLLLGYTRSTGGSLAVWGAGGLVSMLDALCYMQLGTTIQESGGSCTYLLKNIGPLPAFLYIYLTVFPCWPSSATAVALSVAPYVVKPFYPGCPSPEIVVKGTAIACILFIVVNLPRALMIAVPLVTCLYIMVNVSYFTVMSTGELLASGAVAVSWGSRVLGSWMWLMPLSVAMSTFGCMNCGFFSGGRLYYVAAREGHLPAILSMIHVRRLTPSPALMFTAISSIILIIPGNFGSIVNYSSFVTWTIFAATTSSLLYMKIKKPDIPRPYKVPIIVPVLFLMISIYLVLAPVIDKPQIEFLYVFLFGLSGVIIYIPMIHFKRQPEFLRKVTMHLQLLLEVAPTDKFEDD